MAKSNSRDFNLIQINIKEVKKSYQNLDPKRSFEKMILKPVCLEKMPTFLLIILIFQFVLQNFPANQDIQTLYQLIEGSQKLSKENYGPIKFMKDIYSIKQQHISKKPFKYQCGFRQPRPQRISLL